MKTLSLSGNLLVAGKSFGKKARTQIVPEASICPLKSAKKEILKFLACSLEGFLLQKRHT
jgi:hypothetical protein